MEKMSVPNKSGFDGRVIAATAIVNLILLFEISYLGSNNNFGSMLAVTLNMGMAAGVSFIRRRVTTSRITGWIWPALLWSAGLLWAFLPDVYGRLAGVEGLAGLGIQRSLPDMLEVNLWRVGGTIAAIYSGLMLGLMRQSLRPFTMLFLLGSIVSNALFLIWTQVDPGIYMGRSIADAGGRYSGPLLNPNSAATLLGVTALLAIASAQRSYRLRQQTKGQIATIGYAALAIIALIICMTTGSRTGIALTTFLLLIMILRAGQKKIIFYVATVLLLFVILFMPPDIMNLFGSTSTERFANFSDDWAFRMRMWTYYLDIALEHPWTGYGMFSFSDVNLGSLHEVRNMKAFWNVNAAHNILIEMMMEGGIPYLLLTGGAVMLMVQRIRSGLDSGRERALAFGMLMALALILGVSLIDIALTVPAIQSVAGVFIGLLWARSSRTRQVGRAA